MKTIYDALNDVRVNTEDYEVSPLSETEKEQMKQGFHRASGHRGSGRIARWSAVAACLICVVGFSQTDFAKAAISDILQSINLGHNSIIQVDPSKDTKKSDFSKYYDKNGKPVTSVNPNGTTDLYDANGNKVGSVKVGKNDGQDTDTVAETDLKKAVSQLSFQPLLPKDLPAGYAFEKAELYKDDNGKLSGDYVVFLYKNGSNQIRIDERKISDKTAYAVATDGAVQKTTINGHVAAIYDGTSIDWEADGTSVGIVAKGLSTDQLTKLAESVK